MIIDKNNEIGYSSSSGISNKKLFKSGLHFIQAFSITILLTLMLKKKLIIRISDFKKQLELITIRLLIVVVS